MEDHLPLLAEIAVGLAGFSSIVVIFRRGSDRGAWEPEDVFRLKLMLESSLVAALFAILPAAVMGVGLSGPYLWPALSAALLSYVLVRTFRVSRTGAHLPAGSLNTLLFSFMITMAAVASAVQVLNIAGWLVPRGSGPYLFGVSWLIVYAGIIFYRLVTAPITESGSGHPPAA